MGAVGPRDPSACTPAAARYGHTGLAATGLGPAGWAASLLSRDWGTVGRWQPGEMKEPLTQGSKGSSLLQSFCRCTGGKFARRASSEQRGAASPPRQSPLRPDPGPTSCTHPAVCTHLADVIGSTQVEGDHGPGRVTRPPLPCPASCGQRSVPVRLFPAPESPCAAGRLLAGPVLTQLPVACFCRGEGPPRPSAQSAVSWGPDRWVITQVAPRVQTRPESGSLAFSSEPVSSSASFPEAGRLRTEIHSGACHQLLFPGGTGTV